MLDQKLIMGSKTKDSDGKTTQDKIIEHSQSKLVDSDYDFLADPESVIQFTRTPKKPPQYKPRSRKLEDLPGGIRVPIIQRENSRVKPRLDAGREGLQELKSLREAQQQLVTDATKTYQREHEQVRTNRFHKSFSTSILSCITEENNNSKQSEDACPTSSSQADDIDLNTSYGSRNFESRHGALDRGSVLSFHASSVRGRRASIQVDSDYFKQCANVSSSLSNSQPESKQQNLQMNPRLRSRRPSFQVDSIITDRSHTISTAQLISEMKLQYNLPGPLRAVMRQYGSSSTLNAKEYNCPENTANHDSAPSPTRYEAINVPQRDLGTHSNKLVPKLERNHSRGGSSTSDYFGSLENICPHIPYNKGITSPTVPNTEKGESLSDLGQDSVLGQPMSPSSPQHYSDVSSKLLERDSVLESRSSISEYSDEGFNTDDVLESPNDQSSTTTHNSTSTVAKTQNIESVPCVTTSQSAKTAASIKTNSLLETAL
ncbi:hypothetical protein FSP39_015887 [Pinctada imbricata]|uniref:Uncharacterized protein n=1 Tax=Pinctada imbricata TaxID=66713 RepID=A0AA88XV74_PINIB|nr:hypothetical protein FSP39_015887 [Pinctada imbricata]